MQFGRGLVWIGGVAVVGASPAGEQTRASRVAAAREKRKAARERSRQKAESAAAEAIRSDAEAIRTEAGPSRAAAERRAREGGTGAGGAREPRSTAARDRARIEALFSKGAEMPGEKADTPGDESSSETPDERDPESAPEEDSVGDPTVMDCATDAWFCNLFNLAFQLPNTIPVICDGREAIYIPFSRVSGEIWVRVANGIARYPVPRMTNPGQVCAAIS